MGPEIIGVFIPIILGLGAFAMVFGLRYMNNKENMAMIDKGLNPRDASRRAAPAPYKSLKWGLVLVGAGIGLLAAYFIDATVLPYRMEPAGLYFALIGIGGGLGLILSYRIEKKEVLDKKEENL